MTTTAKSRKQLKGRRGRRALVERRATQELVAPPSNAELEQLALELVTTGRCSPAILDNATRQPLTGRTHP